MMSEQDLLVEDAGQDHAQHAARSLLTQLALCLRLATLHHLANQAMNQPIHDFLQALNDRLAEGEAVAIQSVDENFFLNNEVIKLDYTTFDTCQRLRAVLKRIGVDELAFAEGELSEAEWRGFLELFQRHYRGKEPGSLLQESFPRIRLRRLEQAGADPLAVDIDERQNLVRTYGLLTLSIKNTLGQLRRGQAPRLVSLRKAIHGLADAVPGHESLLIGLTRSPNMSGQTHHHLAGVTALVLLMARRLCLSPKDLTRVCLAAAFHDLARDELPAAPRGDGGDVSGWEVEARRVPLRSMLWICQGSLSGDVLDCAATAYEQSCSLRSEDGFEPGGAARLIAVPCAFDLLTQSSSQRALSPDRALRLILENTDRRFDERVARLFAATIGLYPVGTVVRLSGGQTAVVMEVPADPADYALPVVKVFQEGTAPADYVVDLAQPGAGLEITETVDPIEADVNATSFLLA